MSGESLHGRARKYGSSGFFASIVALALVACARPPQAPPPVVTPPPPATVAPAEPEPERFVSPLPPLAAGFPAAPASCAAFVEPPPVACTAPLLDGLDTALGSTDANARDAALAALEGCEQAPRGLVRALRAELAPKACADLLVAAYFDAVEAPGPTPEVASALVGLALGARLARLDAGPPALPEPFTKEQFERYFREQLEPWVSARARAIFELSSHGATLHGYGRGVVAVEAAVADLRFVQMARDVPLPEEMKRDAVVRDEYYAALDLALEPRKTRGRDAALAGLAAFAELGVIESERIAAARAILSQSYAGHRIDALDGLRLPPLPALDASSAALRVAARLPTFHAQQLFSAELAENPAFLRALLERGVSPLVRGRLEASALPAETALLYARALVALGQRYWKSENFAKAASFAATVPPVATPVGAGSAASFSPADSAALLAALSRALKAGPADARAMMLGGPLLPAGVGDVKDLDALSAGKGELAALAAYDAAYVLAFLPPTENVREFWNGIAARYEKARKLSRDPVLQQDAKARAEAARVVAKAVKE